MKTKPNLNNFYRTEIIDYLKSYLSKDEFNLVSKTIRASMELAGLTFEKNANWIKLLYTLKPLGVAGDNAIKALEKLNISTELQDQALKFKLELNKVGNLTKDFDNNLLYLSNRIEKYFTQKLEIKKGLRKDEAESFAKSKPGAYFVVEQARSNYPVFESIHQARCNFSVFEFIFQERQRNYSVFESIPDAYLVRELEFLKFSRNHHFFKLNGVVRNLPSQLELSTTLSTDGEAAQQPTKVIAVPKEIWAKIANYLSPEDIRKPFSSKLEKTAIRSSCSIL